MGNETDSSTFVARLKVDQLSDVKGLGDAKQCDTSQKGSYVEEQSPESAFSLALMSHGVPKLWPPQLACFFCWLEIPRKRGNLVVIGKLSWQRLGFGGRVFTLIKGLGSMVLWEPPAGYL